MCSKWSESECDKYVRSAAKADPPRDEEEMPEDRGIKEKDVGGKCVWVCAFVVIS